MERMAAVSSQVAQIQHDNLLDVQNFIERGSIRVLEMEWVDGYDLDSLLAPGMLGRAKARVGQKRWEYINNVIATAGGRTRLKLASQWRLSASAWPDWPPIAKKSSTATSSRRTSWSSDRQREDHDIGSARPQRHAAAGPAAAIRGPGMLDREEITPRSDLATSATCSSNRWPASRFCR
jgi:serine/threonine-protein kinase